MGTMNPPKPTFSIEKFPDIYAIFVTVKLFWNWWIFKINSCVWSVLVLGWHQITWITFQRSHLHLKSHSYHEMWSKNRLLTMCCRLATTPYDNCGHQPVISFNPSFTLPLFSLCLPAFYCYLAVLSLLRLTVLTSFVFSLLLSPNLSLSLPSFLPFFSYQ